MSPNKFLILACSVLLLASPTAGQTTKSVTFHTQPSGAKIFLQVSGTGPGHYLGLSGSPVDFDPERVAGQSSFDIRFEAEGCPPTHVTLRSHYFETHDRYPIRGEVQLGEITPERPLPWVAGIVLAAAFGLVALRRGKPEEEAPISSDPLIGKTMGPYRLEARLGSGATSGVYRASKGEVRVALKVFLADGVQPSVKKRFQKEVESYTRVRHDRVLRLLDWGEQGQYLYLATELHQGSLREYLQQVPPLSIDKAVEMMKQLLEAVGYLHEHQLVHRDLKPENILRAVNGDWILGDFGLARSLETTAFSTMGAVGTLGYAAPEQLAGEELTEATDQYALGVIFYELLTGSQPFDSGGAGLAIEHLTKKIPPPSSVAESVPEALDEVVLRMTHKSPAKRYPTLGQALKALRELPVA